MDTNIDISKNIESGVQFSKKLLNIAVYIGIIGAVLSVMSFVFTIDNGFPVETVSNIGDKMTSLAEIVFISLISYKIYKDGIAKPSYALLACFAGVIALDFIVGLISEEVGLVTSIIYLISSVGAGVILFMAKDTKKIGLWSLLSVAGSIILLAVVTNDDFENSQKAVAIALAALYCYPYAKYLESCQKFLVGKEMEENSTN